MLNNTQTKQQAAGQHMVVPIPFKAHKVNNMQAELFESIFEDHYGADVRKLNQLEMENLEASQTDTAESDCVTQRDWLKYANSTLLHAAFFNGIGDQSEEHLEFDPSNSLGKAIIRDFGSIEKWVTDFSSSNDEAVWAVLAWSFDIERLVNVSIAESALAVFGLKPIMALNLHPYAYEDYFDQDTDQYAALYLQNVNWSRLNQQFESVLAAHPTNCHPHVGGDDNVNAVNNASNAVTVCELKKMADQQDDAPLILDVRHQDDRERYQHRIMKTEWRDSFKVSTWSDDLPKNKPIVVYCMYGFWVSQDVATELRSQGYDARTLIGGINSWRAMGYESNQLDLTSL